MSARNAIKSTAYHFTLPLLRFHAKRQQAVIGLSYHRFELQAGADPRPHMAITPETFRKHLEKLATVGTFISMDNYLDNIQRSKIQFLLSFDDGYADNYAILPNILSTYNIPCCIYVVTAFVEGRLQCLPHDANSAHQPKAMTRDQLLELSQHPLITIGAHTVDHPLLRTLSPKAQRQQLADSKKALEQLIQKPVLHFAIPSGQAQDFDWRRTIHDLTELQYQSFATNFGGINAMPKKEPLIHIRRTPMPTHCYPTNALGWALGWANPREYFRPKCHAVVPSILTNMAFWQNEAWQKRTDSIYDLNRFENTPSFFPAWKEAWLLFHNSRKYDIIHTMGARTSLFYGLLCVLSFRPSRQILTEVFFDPPRPLKVFRHLKNLLYRWVGKRSLGVITNSSREVHLTQRRLGISSSKIRYIPLHTSLINPYFSEKNEGYVLAAGKSLRDYETLLKVAPEISSPIIIICGESELRSVQLPEGVTLYRNLPYDEYLDYFKRACFVAIPLQKTARASGQVVALTAMSLGKPVVATRAPGTLDIIQNGKNGMLVPPQDSKALKTSIHQLLDDPDLCRRLGRQALLDIEKNHTFDIHVQRRTSVLEEFWAKRDQ